MPSFKLHYLSILIGITLALSGCSSIQKAVLNQPDHPITASALTAPTAAGQSQPDRWILVLKPQASMTEAEQACVKSGAKIKHRLSKLNMLVLEVPKSAGTSAIPVITKLPQVQSVGRDFYTQVIRPASDQSNAMVTGQTLPWGIDAVEADQVLAQGLYSGAGVRVAVVDSGIDLTHPDLAANIKGGVNVLDSSKSYDDDNGHGTHVAGIIGAENNTIGVVGVAPGADLYAVKILNAEGWCYLGDIFAGLEWCVVNNMQIVNMSFGVDRANLAPYNNALYNEVIKIVYNYGLVLIAAAGNDSNKAVIAPAGFDQVIAVSAMDSTYHITSWSARGQEIDFIAPGRLVYSTVPEDLYPAGYATWNGTSMATPHVAGAAALLLQHYPWLTPAQVKARLAASATNLNLPVTEQGAGLVNAFNAVQ